MSLPRFLRGLVGTSLTWGVAWSALNTAVLLMRWVPNPPSGVSAADMAMSILKNQSVTTFVWGTVLGALFSIGLAAVARRRPTSIPLQPARLARVGATAGLGLGALAAGAAWSTGGSSGLLVSPWIAVLTIAVSSAGVGALLGVTAARAHRRLEPGEGTAAPVWTSTAAISSE